MTPDDVARAADIRARADAATEGPWRLVHPDSAYSSLIDPDCLPVAMTDGQMVRADAEFIAAARSDVPWLLDRLAAETAENERLREAIELSREFADGQTQRGNRFLAERGALTERADKAEAAVEQRRSLPLGGYTEIGGASG